MIMDGRIQHKNLSEAGLDIDWLMQQLKIKGLKPRDIFYAYLDRPKKSPDRDKG